MKGLTLRDLADLWLIDWEAERRTVTVEVLQKIWEIDDKRKEDQR